MRGLPPIASEHELADELEIKRFVEKFFKAFVLSLCETLESMISSIPSLVIFLTKLSALPASTAAQTGNDVNMNADANTAESFFHSVFPLFKIVFVFNFKVKIVTGRRILPFACAKVVHGLPVLHICRTNGGVEIDRIAFQVV